VPLLAKGKTIQARRWTYVRDDQPFGGRDPPAAVFRFSRDRSGEPPERHLARYAGILQADAFAGFTRLYRPDRSPGPIIAAACWAHARRPFFVFADIASKARAKKPIVVSPLAFEAVQRLDAIVAAERAIRGLPADQRLGGRRSRPWSTTFRPGWRRREPSCRAMPTWRSRWTTC
jgi:transposase